MTPGDIIMKPKRRILIVDDDYDVRNVLSQFLRSQGYAVETAENGLNALQVLAENHFDAVLTDFHMPRMDGLTLARQIRIDDPQTFIIIITSDIWMSAQEESFADYVVEKPFKLNEIYNILQCALKPTVLNCTSSYL